MSHGSDDGEAQPAADLDSRTNRLRGRSNPASPTLREGIASARNHDAESGEKLSIVDDH
jgi:hypothetical protein